MKKSQNRVFSSIMIGFMANNLYLSTKICHNSLETRNNWDFRE